MKRYAELTAVMLGLSLGLFLLWLVFKGGKTAFDEIGLGIGTVAQFQTLDGRHVHCRNLNDAMACIDATNARDPKARIALLGWSQLHGVNQYRDGDRTAPWRLAKSFEARTIDFLTLSQPLSNPQEQYVLLHWLQTQSRFDGLVIGAWLQGMREENVRPAIAIAAADARVRARLEGSEQGRMALELIDKAKDASAPETASFQQRVEASLIEALKSQFALWRVRSEAEGRIRLFFQTIQFQLVKIRNLLLGLKKDKWIWNIPPARYDKNIAFLEAIVRQARAEGLDVLVYVPPRPADIHFHFDEKLYARFKNQVEVFAMKSGASFVNLEDCVKGDVWGMTRDGDGELVKDMTHFTASGHGQLAACLEDAVTHHFEWSR